MIICKDCNKEQPFSEYYTYPTKTKGMVHRKICRTCLKVDSQQVKVMRKLGIDDRVTKCIECDLYYTKTSENINHCQDCRRKLDLCYSYRSANWRDKNLDSDGIWRGEKLRYNRGLRGKN